MLMIMLDAASSVSRYFVVCIISTWHQLLTFYSAQDAFVRQYPDDPLPDPQWYPLMQEVPGDCDGEVLLQFELVPKTSPGQIIESNIDISPKTRTAYIEIIALGARDMKPYNFLPMQSPMLEFELDTVKGKVVASTEPSKRHNKG